MHEAYDEPLDGDIWLDAGRLDPDGAPASQAKAHKRVADLEELERRARSSDKALHELEEHLRSLLSVKPGEVPDRPFERPIAAAIAAKLVDCDYRRLAAARIFVWADRLPIPRGKIDLYAQVPRLSRSETPVLYFTVIGLPDGDKLLRENHDSKGYHYHYSDDGKRRADVLLTLSRAPEAQPYPVTWEHHAVKKADFEARVERWGNKRKLAVNSTCGKDAEKRGIGNFLRPSAEAKLIIPVGEHPS